MLLCYKNPVFHFVMSFVCTTFAEKKGNIMALEIKAIPTLHGEAAERFLKLAEASPEERKNRIKIKIDPEAVKKVLRKSGMI